MLRMLTTIVLAASFVAHGLLGCCWHHAHDRCATSVADQPSVSHCKHRHARYPNDVRDVKSQSDGQSAPAHEPTGCNEGRCDFVLVQQDECVDIGLAQLIHPNGVAHSNELVDVSVTPFLLGFSISASNARASSPHCALCQVWLI